MVVALVVIAVLVLGLPLLALVVGPRLRPLKPATPLAGSDDRTRLLAKELGEPTATEPPAGLTPGQCGTLAAPDAHYQHLTATLLDLARRDHVHIALRRAPDDTDLTAWWTLTLTLGTDELADYEQTLLTELDVLHHPASFPSLSHGSGDRVLRPLRHASTPHTGDTADARAFQRGVAQHPAEIDARWYAHAVALDVSSGLARSLTSRRTPTPPWVTSSCHSPISWTLIDALALTGSPLLPQGPFQAGYSAGGAPMGN